MNLFKHRHFQSDMIIWAARWCCKYGISYRELEEMLCERGIKVDHTTIYRWVQRDAPKIEKRLKWYWRPGSGVSWPVDQTYVKVKGKWVYLYRAIDFYLSSRRHAQSAKRFLGKALRGLKEWEKPLTINTDQAPAYGEAIRQLKNEGKCPKDLKHRQIKYLNNRVEADQGLLKRRINPVRGFQSMKTAYVTIKGFEVMCMFKKGPFKCWQYGQGLVGEIRLITNGLLDF